MEKINNYKEKEKLPTIYSQNIKSIKSLTPKIKDNLINSFDYSLYNNKVKLRNNSYYLQQNNNIIDNNNLDKSEKIKKYLKIVVNKDNSSTDRTNILTNYNNNIIFKKSKFNEILYKIKNKNNYQSSIFKNKTLNKNNDLFSDSYYKFILNLKMKREASNKNNNENKNENNNDEKKLSNYNSIFKNQKQLTIENQKINSDNLSLSKTLDNKIIKSKTPSKIKLLNNNIKTNYFQLNHSNRNNVFGLSNDKYSLNNNSIHNKSVQNKVICSLCQREIDYYRYKSHFNSHPSKIFNWLYLGSFRNACNIKDLKDLKINYILNCAIECENNNLPLDITCYHAKINDFPNFQINTFFDKTNSFINKAKLSGGNILIHCQLGISRSTTCLIAYMIKYLGYTTLNALQYIKKKRSQIMPNFGFIQQLKNYENKVKLIESKNKIENIDEYNKKNEKNFDLFLNQIN